ncbi:hypothetical protein WDZ17_09800 [Pseudokineococcus basanitobsidens]|uniref:Uncharacterized protein n=1 Tax=Pseudokineococcus basanitobsidens TaxID=1926649 RepID=A0ABU8RKP7_9ACTN
MYLQQQHRRAPALVPVTSCAVVMLLAAVAALVLAAHSAPAPVVQGLAALGVLALVGVRLTAPRARVWWARPMPGAVRRPR